MSILVTGSTGHTGRKVVQLLADRGVDLRALTRDPGTARLPANVAMVQGSLSDPDALPDIFRGVATLLLIVPNVPDEFYQTMAALNMARDAGIERIVYVSVYGCDGYVDVPHVVCKSAVERMIGKLDLPVTILRAAYFMQNDFNQKHSLLDAGLYDMPMGDAGIACVSADDLAEIAANELMRRHASASPLPMVRYDVVGPQNLTGSDIASIWSRTFGRDIVYGGDDLDRFESHTRPFVPAGFANDLRRMFHHYQQVGTQADKGQLETMMKLLGRPPVSYATFAEQTARSWLEG